jgi:hypothetical protein
MISNVPAARKEFGRRFLQTVIKVSKSEAPAMPVLFYNHYAQFEQNGEAAGRRRKGRVS